MITVWSRHLLAIFPIVLILARLGRHPMVHQGQVAALTLFMGGLFVLYTSSRWAF